MTEIEELQANVATLQTENRALAATLDLERAARSAAQSDVQTLRVDVLTEAGLEKDAYLEKHREELESAKGERDNAAGQADAVGRELDAAESTRDEALRLVEAVASELDAARAEIEALKKKLIDANPVRPVADDGGAVELSG